MADTDGPDDVGQGPTEEMKQFVPPNRDPDIDTYLRVTGKTASEVFTSVMDLQIRTDETTRSSLVNKLGLRIDKLTRSKMLQLTMHFRMSEFEQNIIRETFPEVNVTFTGIHYHPHAQAAATRNIEEAIMVKTLLKTAALTPEGIDIVDVGGNFERHYHAKRRIHSCNPVLTPRDSARTSRREIGFSRMRDKTREMAEFDKDFADKTTSMGVNALRCGSRAQDCPVTCENVMFVHSTYDMNEAELCDILDAKGAIHAMAVMMFDPEILIKTEGHLRYGVRFQKYSDPITHRLKIKFFFENSLDLSYVHDYVNYIYLVSTSAIRGKDGAVRYWCERTWRRNGTLFIEIFRNTSNYVAGLNLTTVWFSSGLGKVVVETYTWDTTVNAADNPMMQLKRKIIVVDKKYFDSLYKWTLSKRDQAFTVQSVEGAASALSARVTVSGTDVLTGADLVMATDIPALATAVYLLIYISRYDQSKVLLHLKKEIENTRERPGFIRQAKNCFSSMYRAVRDSMREEGVDDAQGASLRTQFLLWRSNRNEFQVKATDMVSVVEYEEYWEKSDELKALQQESVLIPWQKDTRAMMYKELRDASPLYSDPPAYYDVCNDLESLQLVRAPADGECGYFSLALTAGLNLTPQGLRNKLLDSPYLQCLPADEKKQVVHTLTTAATCQDGWCDENVIKLFAFTFSKRVCVHDVSGTKNNYRVFGRCADKVCHIEFTGNHFDALVPAPVVPTMTFVEQPKLDDVARVRNLLASVDSYVQKDAVFRACRVSVTKAPYNSRCRDVFCMYEVMKALLNPVSSMVVFTDSLKFVTDMGNPCYKCVVDATWAPVGEQENVNVQYVRYPKDEYEVTSYHLDVGHVDFAYVREQAFLSNAIARASLIFSDTSIMLVRIRKFEEEDRNELNLRCVGLMCAWFREVKVVEPVSIHARSTDVYLCATGMRTTSETNAAEAKKVFDCVLTCLMTRLTILKRVASRATVTRNLSYEAAGIFYDRYYSKHYTMRGGGAVVSLLDEDAEFALYEVDQQVLALDIARKLRTGAWEPLMIRNFDDVQEVDSAVHTSSEDDERTVHPLVAVETVAQADTEELQSDMNEAGLQIKSTNFDVKYVFKEAQTFKNIHAFFHNAAVEIYALWKAYTRTVESEAVGIFTDLAKNDFNPANIRSTFFQKHPDFTLTSKGKYIAGVRDFSEHRYKLVWDPENYRAKFMDAKAESTSYELYSSFTKLALEREFAAVVEKVDLSFKADFKMPKLQLIKGVPGCGKTEFIRKQHAEGVDLVLTTSREGRQQFLKRIKNANPKKYKTTGSYLLNSREKSKVVWVDEVYMMHPGWLYFIAYYSQCETMYLVGDPCQIPYINRLVIFDLKYHQLPKSIPVHTKMEVSHRIPQDVVEVLRDVYAAEGMNLTTTSLVKSSLTVMHVTGKELIPADCDVMLTFKQVEAEELRKYVRIHPHRAKTPVHTVHEYQGGEHDNGVMWRSSCIESDTIYTSQEHIVVALTRHRKRFVYCVPSSLSANTSDGIYRRLKKLPSVTFRGGGSSEITRNASLPSGDLRMGMHNGREKKEENESVDDYDYAGLVGKNKGDDPVKALAAAERYFHLNAIVAVQYPRFEYFEYERDYTSWRVPLPEEADLHISDLQNVYDLMRPGHSTVDLTYDAWQVQHGDLSFEIDILEFNTNNLPTKERKMGYMVPELKTSCPIVRDTTAKESLLALMKRNKNIPNIKFNMDDYELARLMFAKFLDVYIENPSAPEDVIRADLTTTAEWLSRQGVDTVASAEDEALMFRLRRLNEYRFMIKKHAKPKLDDSALTDYLSLQTICYQGPYTNVLLCPIFREIRKRFLSRLKKKFLLFVDMSVHDLENILTEMNIPENYEPIEVDISKYDKSQGLPHLLFEIEVFRFFGLSEDLCKLWYVMHECTILYDSENRIKTSVVFQRKSGDAATFLGNTLVLMATLACVFNFGDIYAGMFAGDDSLLFSKRKMKFDNHAMANAFGFDAKLLNNRFSMFCSKFVLRVNGRWKVLPDFLKLLTKLGRHDLRNEEHVELYYVSTKDQLVHLDDLTALAPLTCALKERYGVDVSILSIARVVRFLKRRETFHKLYSRPVGVPLMKNAPTNLIDI